VSNASITDGKNDDPSSPIQPTAMTNSKFFDGIHGGATDLTAGIMDFSGQADEYPTSYPGITY